MGEHIPRIGSQLIGPRILKKVSALRKALTQFRSQFKSEK